ncbi:MAG: type II toxin-antitoxin system prevent-host-death family antitoxin [Bifidobacteriaceae bacterium]|jgi:prevent-host-death family protein|nr:type II toxin-antitoxin system prevent-host-death family antitoxin [Bifidobacteriaceae bacterium]
MAATLTIREVNQHTSAVFQRVQNGEELVITKSGRPLARVIPFRPVDSWERLVAAAKIIPAKTQEELVPHLTEPLGIDIDALLEEERADRRFW